MKIVSIIGARPQFVKAAMLSRRLREKHSEFLVHTGQHYDESMSDIFFRELDIPAPNLNLDVGSGSHGEQTGAMLAGIEKALLAEKPDRALVYGDTNSTLAGALAAAKLHIPAVHVEAGLRSFNRAMPEEINRVVADHLADILLCPSRTAVDNLAAEGVTRGVHLVGDVMADAIEFAATRAAEKSGVLDRLKLKEREFMLATVHRAENTDDPTRLTGILEAFGRIDATVVFPVHPRTRKAIREHGCEPRPNVRLIEPVGYLDMVMLERSAKMILTDSGGVQKEAYWLGAPCVTLREETEWVETVAAGWNRLAGADADRIVEAVVSFSPPSVRPPLYGDGKAAEKCVAAIESGV